MSDLPSLTKSLKSKAEGEAVGYGMSTKDGKQRRFHIFIFSREDEE